MIDPRPLVGEPLPLDLLNTTWISGGEPHDMLADQRGVERWLAGHGFQAPSDAAARRALHETREALRGLLSDRSSPAAREAVNAVLARGARRPLLGAGGTTTVEVDAAAAWRVPWLCAVGLVELLDARGERIRRCANPGCVLWFLDVSRPGARSWCSMSTCGNRDKALRHGRLAHR